MCFVQRIPPPNDEDHNFQLERPTDGLFLKDDGNSASSTAWDSIRWIQIRNRNKEGIIVWILQLQLNWNWISPLVSPLQTSQGRPSYSSSAFLPLYFTVLVRVDCSSSSHHVHIERVVGNKKETKLPARVFRLLFIAFWRHTFFVSSCISSQ